MFRGKNPAAAETFVTLDKVYFALVLSGLSRFRQLKNRETFMRGLCQERPPRAVILSLNAIEPRFYPQSGRLATVAH